MKRAAFTFFLFLFFAGGLIPLNPSRSAADLPEDEIRSTVRKLIDSKGAVFIQGIHISRDREGKLSLEIFANLGSCWGKEEFARIFALEALKALFLSDLPLMQVTLNIRERNKNLLTVSLGKNQAAKMNWEEEGSPVSFYERLRSRMQYAEDPADSCWLIEKESRSTP